MNKLSIFTVTALVSLLAFPAVAGVPAVPAQSCDHRFDWPDDPAAHVLNGPLDGTFDYDFEGAAIDTIAGNYSADQHAASWEVTYSAGHYLEEASVDSTGSVSLNGDLEVMMTTTTTDSLGQVWEETVRRMRTGCEEQRQIDPKGLALNHVGVWSAGRYDYEEQRPLLKGDYQSHIADVTGTLYIDGSSELTAIYTQAGEEASTSIAVEEQRNLDGERWIQFELLSLDAVQSSSTTISADGTTTRVGEFDYDAEWEFDVTWDYTGQGSGWLYSGPHERYCYLDIGEICTKSCWQLEDLEEYSEELEDQDIDWSWEFGDYIDELTPTKVDNNCAESIFEDYVVMPF